MIPKIIHRTFPTFNFGPNIQKNLDATKELNPGWEHRFYDDNNVRQFIQTNYDSSVLHSYDRINPDYGPARADLFRYLLIYKLGGVYLDIKSTSAKPLDMVILPDDEYLLGQWPLGVGGRYPELKYVPYGEYQQWHIIARPNHPFLRAVISRVLSNIEVYHPHMGVGKIGVLRTTGPIAYTQSIYPLLPLYKHRFVGRESLTYNVLSATGLGQGHRSIFTKHYTQLTTPVIIPNIPESSNSRTTGFELVNGGAEPPSGSKFEDSLTAKPQALNLKTPGAEPGPRSKFVLFMKSFMPD